MLAIGLLQNTLLSAHMVFTIKKTQFQRMDRALGRELSFLMRKRIGGQEGDRKLSCFRFTSIGKSPGRRLNSELEG